MGNKLFLLQDRVGEQQRHTKAIKQNEVNLLGKYLGGGGGGGGPSQTSSPWMCNSSKITAI